MKKIWSSISLIKKKFKKSFSKISFKEIKEFYNILIEENKLKL